MVSFTSFSFKFTGAKIRRMIKKRFKEKFAEKKVGFTEYDLRCTVVSGLKVGVADRLAHMAGATEVDDLDPVGLAGRVNLDRCRLIQNPQIFFFKLFFISRVPFIVPVFFTLCTRTIF